MKKVILFTAILLISNTIFAQSKARVGIRTGANITTLTNLDIESKTSFYFGVLLALKISESYTLQPEVSYTEQGGTLTGNGHILRAENEQLKDININFLSLTVLNKIHASNNLNFLIGPFVDFRLDDNINNDGYFLEGLFPRIDVGVTVGLGYDISDSFSVEARFKHGFIDAVNEHDIYENAIADDSNYNQVFQVGIAYKFSLKQTKK